MIDCKKGIVHLDALEILIEALNSNGMSLEKHMVENSIFICPDKVKKQMEELESLLKTHQTEPHDYLVAGNSKLPVRYSSDKTNVIYKPGTGITDCKTGYAISMANDIYTEIHSGRSVTCCTIRTVTLPHSRIFSRRAIRTSRFRAWLCLPRRLSIRLRFTSTTA